MANISVRNLDDSVVERLKRQAESNGRSLESEIRQILSKAVKPTLAESAERFKRFREEHFGDRVFDDSSVGIREDRDR